MSFSNVDWTLAGGIIITGLVVVFFVLAFLWFAVTIIGKVGSAINAKQSANKPQTTAVPTPSTSSAPVAHVALSGEIIAAITAAVADSTDKNFVIKSIALKGEGTPLWTCD